MVFSGGAQEGDAPDVDFLYGVCELAVGFGDGGGEWVKVADDDRDRRDRLGLQILFVRWDGSSEDAWICVFRAIVRA